MVAAWHSLAWLYVANLIGRLACNPVAFTRWRAGGSANGATAGGPRFISISSSTAGWRCPWWPGLSAFIAPIAAQSPSGPAPPCILWSLALTLGAFSWLQGNSSGKLFLDWSGFVRIFFPSRILFLWCSAGDCVQAAWRDPDQSFSAYPCGKALGLAILVVVPFLIYIASIPYLSRGEPGQRRADRSQPTRIHADHRSDPLVASLRTDPSQARGRKMGRGRVDRLCHRSVWRVLPRSRRRQPPSSSSIHQPR